MLREFFNPSVCLPCSLPSLAQANAKKRTLPNDENMSAGLATRATARNIRGHNRLSRARVDELSTPARVSIVPVCMHVEPVESMPARVSSVSVSMHDVPVVPMPLPEGSRLLPKVRAPKQARAPKTVSLSLP
jgi:hypothetical protein